MIIIVYSKIANSIRIGMSYKYNVHITLIYCNNGFEKKQDEEKGRCETFLNRVMQIPKRKMVAIIHLDESASSFFRHDKSVACSRSAIPSRSTL